jgi:hypothetical protein
MPSIGERHDDPVKRGLDMLCPHCAIARIPAICVYRNRFAHSIEYQRGVFRDHRGPYGYDRFAVAMVIKIAVP